jgi:hypothetical protein
VSLDHCKQLRIYQIASGFNVTQPQPKGSYANGGFGCGFIWFNLGFKEELYKTN